MAKTRFSAKRVANAKATFIKTLSETGNVSASAAAAAIGRRTAYSWRQDDTDFAQDWLDAEEVAADALELEARRRAHDGVDEPVFQKGEEVGTIRKYSDTLMCFLLSGVRPDKFARRTKGEISGPGGRPIETKNINMAPNLALLNNDQLATLEKLLAAATPADTDAGEGGDSTP